MSAIDPETLYVVFTDGGTKQKTMAFGFLVYDSNDPTQIIYGRSGLCGNGTSNDAEYAALRIAVKSCKAVGMKRLWCYTDSKIMAQHASGKWEVKDSQMSIVMDDILDLSKSFSEFKVIWIRRHHNKLADALVRSVFVNKRIHNEPKILQNNVDPIVRGRRVRREGRI